MLLSFIQSLFCKNDQVHNFCFTWTLCLDKVYQRYFLFLIFCFPFSDDLILKGLTQEDPVLVEKLAFKTCDDNKDSKLNWTEVDDCEVSSNRKSAKR